MDAKFSEILGKVSFLENFAYILNEWPPYISSVIVVNQNLDKDAVRICFNNLDQKYSDLKWIWKNGFCFFIQRINKTEVYLIKVNSGNNRIIYKIYTKSTRTTSTVSLLTLTYCSDISIVDFEQVNATWTHLTFTCSNSTLWTAETCAKSVQS